MQSSGKKHIYYSLAFLGIVLLGCAGDLDNRNQQETQLEPVMEIAKVDESLPEIFRETFSKQVDVFGIQILATRDVPDDKLMHAAKIMAGYLDNDENGAPDNILVVKAMRENRATLVMFETEREAEQVFEAFEDNEENFEIFDSMILQDLYASETHPNGASRGKFDASYEEVLHLITHAGYAFAYPKVFGEKPRTELSNAMDKARGGHFHEVPDEYPANAWYTYDDETCGYGCQATEYIYWGLTSLLGAQDFKGRAEQIGDEWRLNTPEKFKQGDPLLWKLLSDPEYQFPERLPDGKYQASPSQR